MWYATRHHRAPFAQAAPHPTSKGLVLWTRDCQCRMRNRDAILREFRTAVPACRDDSLSPYRAAADRSWKWTTSLVARKCAHAETPDKVVRKRVQRPGPADCNSCSCKPCAYQVSISVAAY